MTRVYTGVTDEAFRRLLRAARKGELVQDPGEISECLPLTFEYDHTLLILKLSSQHARAEEMLQVAEPYLKDFNRSPEMEKLANTIDRDRLVAGSGSRRVKLRAQIEKLKRKMT